MFLSRTNGFLVKRARFNLQSLELDDEGVAGLFGLELARLNYLWSGGSVYGVTRD
jgi:hypothetical protein